MRELPRITVVTPSYNQGEFLEATLRSVLDQGYPNLEYIVMDGGSTDGSVAIIEKYAPQLAYWRSGPDGGQADAIGTGFERATGDVLCWLNSDDLLLPGSLAHVGAFFRDHPRAQFLSGNRIVIDASGREIGREVWPARLWHSHWSLGQSLAQECCFWRRSLYDRVGGIDRSRFFIMDWDLFYRMWRATRFHKTSAFLGCFRVHEEAKNSRHQDVRLREMAEAVARYGIPAPGWLGRRVMNRTDRLQVWIERTCARSRAG